MRVQQVVRTMYLTDRHGRCFHSLFFGRHDDRPTGHGLDTTPERVVRWLASNEDSAVDALLKCQARMESTVKIGREHGPSGEGDSTSHAISECLNQADIEGL